MLASCNDVAQESPHFENGLISALFGPHVERMGSLRPRICRGATSLSTIARPELALQDSSYESRRIKMPTSSCILALEKMRGWLRSLVIEVKTSDAYRISLDKIAEYRTRGTSGFLALMPF